ncbi:hypothetical protein EJ06DRAFT_549478 [Trichodelitschia bisporula]|uniref:RRM domain-containing protein n=1 Tax=Trichodelitschia bisporula TaxID=703511 RepID=A0A6G1HVP4_9PEZI|nr:hypothetical protein EJ06DRAFT_549478 [Trichodelitschia bisporula]
MSSPPQFRGKTLTPVSPKPVHVPSPSNIPILEKQMDPSFHESLSYQHGNHMEEVQYGGGNSGNGTFAAASSRPDAMGDNATRPESTAPTFDNPSGGIDYQALLANLSTNFALPQTDVKSPSTSLPSNPNLPPRPPPQDAPRTHPNYTPGDDIRTYHPHTAATYRASASSSHAQPSPTATSKPMQSPPRRDDLDSESEDVPFDGALQKQFDQFLQFERQNVTEGQWEKFPNGSRLFIGNLPTEKVSKRDIYRRFSRHGKLAQISLKQAYGFVQFMDPESCERALHVEQDQMMRGRKMHLEISKPQKSTRGGGDRERGGRRRSRSPGFDRMPRGVDRYTGGSGRRRDDFRRSPSPRGRGRHVDRYDGRRRSRSRSPVRERYRAGYTPGDNLPLAHREPSQVPDVQILVVDHVDWDFVEYVKRGIQDHGLRCDVLELNPRHPENDVVSRRIVEGVLAIIRLTRANQATSKVPLQVFDRKADKVTWAQYEPLDVSVAAQLVLRAKPVPVAAAPPTYSYQPPQAPPPQANQNVAQLLSALGAATGNPNLGRLLGQPSGAGGSPDIASLLGGLQGHAQAPAYGQPNPGAQQGIAGLDNATLTALLGASANQQVQPAQTTSNQPQPQGQDFQQLLANLAAYKPPS